MIEEFRDSANEVQHEAFQAWRGDHADAFFLKLSTKKLAKLHMATGCWHPGGWALSAEELGGSLTRSLKVCSENPAELLAWGISHQVEIKPCSHCIHLEAFFALEPAEQEAALPSALPSAIEGLARETISLSRSRNGVLKSAALHSARGVCAACQKDFSAILGGLGQRVLEVHHRRQLRLYETPEVTSIGDLAVLCANCHAIVHADPESALAVEELRTRWLAEGGSVV